MFLEKLQSNLLKKIFVFSAHLCYNLKMTVSMGNCFFSYIAIKEKEESDAKDITYKEEIQNEFTVGKIRAQYG